MLRNVATGSLCRQTPIEEGTAIEPALLDLYYKDDALGDPLLTEARVRLLGLVDEAQMAAIEGWPAGSMPSWCRSLLNWGCSWWISSWNSVSTPMASCC